MALQYILPPEGNFSDPEERPAIKMLSGEHECTLSSLPVSVIVAAGENGEIGRGGDMIWHLPADLKHFKKVTYGSPVIMGRRTWESLPKKPLPGRLNIVVTRSDGINGVQTATSIAEAVESVAGEKEIFIIGGGIIYREAMKFANKLYLTRIHASDSEADTFFPMPDESEWKLVEKEPDMISAEGVPFCFETYLRRK